MTDDTQKPTLDGLHQQAGVKDNEQSHAQKPENVSTFSGSLSPNDSGEVVSTKVENKPEAPREFFFEFNPQTNEYGQLGDEPPKIRDKTMELVHVIEKSHADLLERKLKRAMEALKECASTVNCDGRINPKWLIDEIKEIEEMK